MTFTTSVSKEARHSSELSKHPAKVFAAAEHHPITVTRRDGEDLVLMTRRKAEQLAQLSDLAAQLFLATVNKEGSVEQRITNVFPWMMALSQADRQACAQDILDATITSLATNQPHRALTEFHSWKDTATAIAAGEQGNIVDWLDEFQEVERP